MRVFCFPNRMDIQECIQKAIQSALSDLLANLGGVDVAAKLGQAATLELLRKKALLTPAEVSALYGIPAATLATWRSRAHGPNYIKAEGSVYYTHQQLERWLVNNEVKVRR